MAPVKVGKSTTGGASAGILLPISHVPLQHSLGDALAWPCCPTGSGRGCREHNQPAAPDPKPSSHLHHSDIRACLIRINNHLWLFFFCLKSLIRLYFCCFRFSPPPGFSVSMLGRLKGSLCDVPWCSAGMGQSYSTVQDKPLPYDGGK